MLFATMLWASLARGDTDATQNFLHFAKSYCSGGNVDNADIGNGNIFSSAEYASFEWSENDIELYRASIMARFGTDIHSLEGVMPGGSEDELQELSDCNEAHGNTCIQSAGQYAWCHYPEYKCMSKYATQIGEINYPSMNKAESPPAIYTFYYDNALDQPTSFTIDREISTSSQQYMSVTEKLSIGESLKISGGEPGIMSEEVSFSVTFDMSETRSWTKTTSQTFKFQTAIPVDAGSTTMANMTIAKAAYSGTWEAQIDLPYYAKLWCSDKTSGHNEWFIPAHYFMGDAPYKGSGRFTGGAGYDSHVTAVKCPLYARTPADCNKGEELMIPVKVKAATA